MKINDNERKILLFLADPNEETFYEEEAGFWSFAPLMERTGLDRRNVRLACRSLARKGLARFECGLWGEEGPAGAGYSATQLGFDLVHQCHACEDWKDCGHEGRQQCAVHREEQL